ncbi:hypothetical protein ACQ4PT_067197 [Festuca glaucescens]
MQSLLAGKSGCCNGRPWVLVDSIARIGHLRNATTAGTSTSRRFTVEVSFELADPPGVSLCFVHCAGRNESHFIGNPLVLSAAQAFLLLVICFTGSASHGAFHDYFVYRAGPGRPRLDRIPVPYPRDFYHKKVGILPLADGASDHYAVVIPASSCYNHRAGSMKFDLRVFWSRSKTWTTKEALLARDSETDYLKAVSHEGIAGVISFGGAGVLGWVDLWQGILLCNVLGKNPPMRLMQWPVPEPSIEFLEFGLELNHISPRPFRDVTVVNGLIKFVELKSHDSQGWTATIWSRMVSSLDWHQTSTVHSDDISITDSVLISQVPVLLPELFDEGKKRLAWDQVICSSPTLSLTNDDVVHIMVSAKWEHQRQIAYLLVVNIRNKTLEALEKYHGNKMMLLEPTYIASTFPSYLDTTACDVVPCVLGSV